MFLARPRGTAQEISISAVDSLAASEPLVVVRSCVRFELVVTRISESVGHVPLLRLLLLLAGASVPLLLQLQVGGLLLLHPIVGDGLAQLAPVISSHARSLVGRDRVEEVEEKQLDVRLVLGPAESACQLDGRLIEIGPRPNTEVVLVWVRLLLVFILSGPSRRRTTRAFVAPESVSVVPSKPVVSAESIVPAEAVIATEAVVAAKTVVTAKTVVAAIKIVLCGLAVTNDLVPLATSLLTF